MTAAATARILHLFANYKWTGPADPAIRTAARLRARGLDVVFAQAGFVHPGGEHRMAEELARWRMPVVTGLQLRKHFRLRAVLADVAALRAILQRDRIDLVHCHLPGDHLTAALAARRAGPRGPVLVRTIWDADAPPRGLRERYAFARTHGVIAPTAAVAQQVTARFGLPAASVLVQEPVTEPRVRDGANLRARWGLGPEHRVVGITARIQPHRRFDLLWQVAREVVTALPQARFVLLGRGNERDTEALVRRPIEALGLQHAVVLPGYLREPDYSAALRAFDAFLFLVPGSDGTCRAVREAMAAALPVVCTRRGMLPEIVAPPGGAAAGVVADETPQALGAALLSLLRGDALRATVAARALARTQRDMDPERAAAAVHAFYDRLLTARGARG